MKNVKIAYIGGGSTMWAMVFMNDLAFAQGVGGEIALYDIDVPAARRNQRIGERINAHPDASGNWCYTVHEGIEGALAGADFVLISILPGTFGEMRSDVHAPEKYGIYQSVGDTAGPSGVLRSMRTVPMYEHIAREIRGHCPKAWVINLTNPMSMCVKTLYDVFPEIKCFGCCHEVFNSQKFLCRVLEDIKGIKADRRELYTDVSGINHFTWVTGATYGDIDVFALLPQYIDKHYGKDAGENRAEKDWVKIDLYRRFGALGAANDRHLVEFMNGAWYLNDPGQVAARGFALTTVDERIEGQKKRTEKVEEMARSDGDIQLRKSDEEAVELMRAVLGLETRVSNVIIPNEGQARDLPYGCIVETNAVFSNDRVVPVAASPLPVGARNLVVQNIECLEMLYRGIKARDVDAIFSAFLSQPLCSRLTIDQAQALFCEMLVNTRAYLDPYYDIDGYVSAHR